MRPEPRFIDSTSQVEALARDLAGLERLALDTEFHAERRYHPQLYLVQLATEEGGLWVLDPQACDLAALAPVIAGTELLLHGGHHDLGLLHRCLGVWPRAVFDTQRAAGLCGLGYPLRLEHLVQDCLGLELGHGRALSDWSRRPLSSEQLAYAAADVRLLHDLARHLRDLLGSRGRLELACQVSGELQQEALAPLRAVDHWRGWRIAPSLDEPTRRVLQALMQWRDQQGRERDQPPWYLLGDSIALELARTRPRTPAELAADRRVGSGLRKRFGTELLALIGAALADPADAPPPVPRDAPERRSLLEAWAGAQARSSGIAASLALPAPLLSRVAELGPDCLQGWRRTRLGPGLEALWSGRSLVGLEGGRPALVTPGDAPTVASADGSP